MDNYKIVSEYEVERRVLRETNLVMVFNKPDQSTLTVYWNAPDHHHLAGMFYSQLHKSLLNSISQVGIGKNKIIVVEGWFCWRQSNIKKYKINKLFAFQRFIRVKQHWYPPWEVTGSHVAERWTERPGGRYLLMDCLLQSFFTIHDILYYVLYIVWYLNM